MYNPVFWNAIRFDFDLITERTFFNQLKGSVQEQHNREEAVFAPLSQI